MSPMRTLVSPLLPSIPVGAMGVEEEANMQDAIFGEKIIGSENVTLHESGHPGAREPMPLSEPQKMLPSQRAKHWLTHLPYDPACEVCVCNVNALICTTGVPELTRGESLSWLETTAL